MTQAQAPSIETTLDEAFKVPAGWEMGSGTEMTPGGEWDNMMRNMNWEGTETGTGMTPRFDQ